MIDKLFEFLPEAREIFLKRYIILKGVYENPSIGRRALSEKLDLSERIVRDEAMRLRDLDLLEINNSGMNITDKGIETIEVFAADYLRLERLPSLQKAIRNHLQNDSIYVVKKNSIGYLRAIGMQAALVLSQILSDTDVLGVTGGTTVLNVAEEFNFSNEIQNISVVPARGSVGNLLEEQSNSVASKFANKLNAKYHPIYLPDSLDKQSMDILINNHEIKKSYDMLKKIDTLLFGIGRADIMAKKRGLKRETKDFILKNGAVGEAFGHYFDIDGKEIYKHETIGISLEDFLKIKRVIGVAGTKDKAKAIIAVSKIRKDMTLIIDEDACVEILNILNYEMEEVK
ncbi:MAG: sugar-binding domain-containing protein [Tissierellia bacterium]|nr:sugar-binding domain-containing protein [Tissierellia bacterium]